MRGRSFTKQLVSKREEHEYEFDGITISYLDALNKLEPNEANFTLEHYKEEALKVFVRGGLPIFDYYIKADLGGTDNMMMESLSSPWSALDLAEICRVHFRLLIDLGIKAPVEELGTALSTLLKNVKYRIGVDELVACFKIVRLCYDALRMFPKERPSYSLYIPPVDFEQLMVHFYSCRKEMKRIWRGCCKFVDTHVPPPENLNTEWGVFRKTTPHAQLPTHPPLPPQPSPPVNAMTGSSRTGLFLGVEQKVDEQETQMIPLAVEKLEMKPSTPEDQEMYKELAAKSAMEWGLGGNAATSSSTQSSAFPGADAWFK